ncbi:MAG: DNA repair protein RecN [Micavibrio sp.]|nr:MAG: DNA repair protein RecN [Micavibrio sp.]
MLTSLSIKNVVLIDQLTIEFEEGFCALTGETGAGKSILLDSLGLSLGARSESSLVRKGTEQAQVTATFEIEESHPSLSLLKDADIAPDTNLILRRSVSKDGRSKAYINDQPVSAGLLKDIGNTLVEIHSQFETQGLLNPSSHRGMLDEYAGVGGALLKVFDAWKTAEKELVTLKSESEKSKAEEEYLRQSVEDLDGLEPKAGEEENLASLRERLMHREQVLEGLNTAHQVLNGEDDPVRKAWGLLDRIAGKIGAQAQNITGPLDRASSEIQEAIAAIEAISSDLEGSEHNLESIDDRLFALRAQARKHECTIDELPEVRENLAQRLNMIEHADDVLAAQVKKVEKARKAYEGEAKKVSEARKKAAVKLDKLVAKELPPLKLEKARFVTDIAALEESEWGAHGIDKVRFLVATNPGSEPGALNKIASGGEMARFMLALKVVMAEIGVAGSLVFDEVDSGIGGSTADAVGERLARLAQKRQVLVVTHAPQVAARAGHHWIVLKDGQKDMRTNVIPLGEVGQRREEIARMLAGATITNEARAAADKLLETGT